MIKPDPMAPLHLTRGVSARNSAKGVETAPLDEAQARRHIKDLHDAGIEALTIARTSAKKDRRFQGAGREFRQSEKQSR